MPTQVQFRRGTTAQNNSFTGAAGEVSIDTDKDALRIHDGVVAGGFEQARANLSNHNGVGVLTATTFSGNVTGNINSSGISTLNSVVVGGATTALIVNGNARVTGILTVGTSSLTLDGVNDRITVGTGLTITSTEIIIGSITIGSGSLTGTATSTTNIPNLTGAITSVNTTTSLGSFTSANLATALTDETGSGAAVFATSPTLVTPVLGAATGTSLGLGNITLASNGNATILGQLDLGNASDTTLARGGAGVVTIEGVNIVTTSSTDTLTNKTLTSPTLTTPVLGAASASSINVSGIVTATQFVTGVSGSAIGINTNTISGPATITIDPAGVGDNTGLVIIKGDLQIDGTTTTINSTTVTVDDKNIVLGSGAVNDAAADGSGITIESGNGNKTFQFEDTGDNLGSSENLNVATGKVYKVNNTEVLSSTTLGSGVVNSSLTSVGTLTNLSVGNVNSSGIITATTFVGALTGTASSTNNIPNLTGDITSANTVTTLATVNSNVGSFGSGGAIPTITVNAKGLITGVTTTAVNPANDGTLTLAVSGTGLSGSASFTANQSGSSSFTVTSNATNANTVSTIVARDGSGNFSAGTITASLTGTASSTTNIPNLTGDITSVNSVTSIATGVIVNADINASAAIAVSKLAASTISGVTLGNNLNALTISTGLSGSSYNGSGAVTIAIDSTVATLTGTQTLTNKTLTSPTLTTPALGTPASGTLTSCTGLPVSTGISGLAANVATFLATSSSANLISAVTDGTGTGSLVFATSPTLVTPLLGTPTSGNLANCTFPTLNQNTSGSAATLTTGRTIAITGDLTYTSGSFNGSGNVTGTGTLATVNANVGTFGSGGAIPTITVNAKGLITGVTTTAVTSGTTITNDTTTNASRFLTFTSATSGSISAVDVSTSKLIYNPSTGAVSATDFNSTSDINLKENIKIIENPIEKVSQLNGVSFDWKDNHQSSAGVIAQDVEKVLPEIIRENDGSKSVNYNGLIGLLIEAIKEQQKQIDELKANQ